MQWTESAGKLIVIRTAGAAPGSATEGPHLMPQPPLQLPWSAALQERFGFQTPAAFRALEARGLFRWAEESRHADLSQPGDHYLWFNDMEWYQPDELRTFEFERHHKSGCVPFAHAANGDYWCWYPAMEDRGAIPVLLC